MAQAKSTVTLERLEPLVEALLLGKADTAKAASLLAEWGYPAVMDQTEQLRLALRLLECHDDVSNRPESSTTSSRRSEGSHARAKVRSPEADFSS